MIKITLIIKMSNGEKFEMTGNWKDYKSTICNILKEKFIVFPDIGELYFINQIVSIKEKR